MRSDGLTNTKYSNPNRLMFISRERAVQDMYDLEQQPDLEVFVETSTTSSSYSGSIYLPTSPVQCEGDGSSPLKSPPLFRLEPNRRRPDADGLPQLTTGISSPSKSRLSIPDFSNRRLSRLSRFFNTFKSPIGINFFITNFAFRVANSLIPDIVDRLGKQ
jgi:hypothetical protein